MNTSPSSTDTNLLEGIAQITAAATGRRRTYYWRGDGTPYTLGDGVGFYLDLSPDTLLPSVTVAAYPLSDAPDLSDSIVGVQFLIEAADRDLVRDVSADLLDLWGGRWGGMIGAIRLVTASRSSGTNLGQDANGRLSRSENYAFTIHRPSTQRQ